jgi:hypothetical protein
MTKDLKKIYVQYELGNIFPEDLPQIACELLTSFESESLLEIAGMHRPTKQDLDHLIMKAFEISDKEKITPYEKIDLLLNFDVCEDISKDFYFKLWYLRSEVDEKFLPTLDRFTNCGTSDLWTPSDEMEYMFKNLKKEMASLQIENRYRNFI